MLFEPHSGASLRRELTALIGDPAGLAGMRTAARASVRGRDWDVIGEQLVEHYHEVEHYRETVPA